MRLIAQYRKHDIAFGANRDYLTFAAFVPTERVIDMTEEQNLNEASTQEAPQTDADASKRERSTIQFPYNDLDDATTIAVSIHENAGISCTVDQLAAYQRQSMTSGAFRLRLGNAAMFGLTTNERGHVTLTELGRHVADPEHAAEAKAEAFMRVPLYARIFEQYKGYALPPAAALERFMREAGVSPKQTDKARQTFMRSARQAGYFAHGEDRLVRPASPAGRLAEILKPSPLPAEDERGGNGGGGGGGLNLDPLLLALLKKIPANDSEWPINQRLRWFRTFAMNVSQIYDDDDGSPPAELEIKVSGS